MGRVERAYPCAVTGISSQEPERAQMSAIRWIAEQHRAVGGEILLYVPKKGDLGTRDTPISRLSKVAGVVVGTWRGYIAEWSGGPVLAAWPTREKLAEIADDSRTRALCVVPWLAQETAAWEQAVVPELLGGATRANAAVSLDGVVVAGLVDLSRRVNHANNLSGSMDHRDAVAILRELHKGGYQLPADAVYSWALANGWPARGAERLRELTSKIDSGRVVQMKGTSPLGHDALARWKAEASGELS